MSLTPGDKLGPYEILAPIGSGGMGEVWKARDTRLNRIVAIKQTHAPFSERFEREAHAIAALNHPHICQIYDVGPDYLVMEYVEGRPLKGPVPVSEALDLAAQILDALDTAHRKGITHRDLKPDNILVGKSGVKILDFGLAKMDHESESAEQMLTKPLTAEGTVLGTLHYMSPEQIEGQEADARSDIFAFGLVLYELITGQRAFEGKTRTSLVASILKDQPRPLSDLAPLSPPALERVVATCLEKDPDKRWQSAREVKHALEWISTESPGAKAPAPSPPKRGWLWPVVALAAVLAIAGLAYMFWLKPQPPGRVTRFEIALPPGVEINSVAFYVRISPDGTKLAFTSSGGKRGIWIRDLESVESRLLPGTEQVFAPFWSPDSKSLAYGSGNRLMRVEVSGGPPQVLAQSATGIVGSGFWTKDGQIVFGSVPGALERVSASGGVPTPVTVLAAGELVHTLPSLLPDGRHFLYFRQGPTRGIYAGSLDVKPEQQSRQQVAPAEFGATYAQANNPAGGVLFFVRDGTLMAQPFDAKALRLTGDPVPVVPQIGTGVSHAHFSVTSSGVMAYRTGSGRENQLAWVDRSGGIQQKAGDPGRIIALSLAPGESQVALVQSDSNSASAGDVWLLDLSRNIKTRFTTGQAVRVVAGVGPVWSPDGKQLAYASGTGLYVKDVLGATDARMIKQVDPGATVTDWTHDGRFLIYTANGRGVRDVYATPVLGGDSAPAVSTEVVDLDGRVSPDGRWIAYESGTVEAVTAARPEIYVRPFTAPGSGAAPAGPVIQISARGGRSPKWRADGRELYFSSLIDGAIMAAGIEIANGAFKAATPVPLGITYGGTGFSPNKTGQRFLVATPLDQGAQTPITVVTNWEATLKRN